MTYKTRRLSVCGLAVLSVVVGVLAVGRYRRATERDAAGSNTADHDTADRKSVPAKTRPEQDLAALPGDGEQNGAATQASPLDRGVAYLLSMQAEDGGWHSQTYGQFRPGAATTSLALYALSHLPPEEHRRLREPIRRGIDFLLIGSEPQGLVCAPDGESDYPTYDTAMLLVALARTGETIDPELHARLVEFLITTQLTERHGFEADNLHHGGWDMVRGTGGVQKKSTSGTNVSVTSFALEALAGSEHPQAAEVLGRAARWAARCQNLKIGGGFFFAVDRADLNNKAQWNDEARTLPRSYGTATCDGVRCLLACGEKPDGERVRAGLAWLAGANDPAVVPGFVDQPDRVGWDQGLTFYYYARLARLLRLMDQDVASRLRIRLAELLAKRQRSDGSWKNDAARMREDDPLIATSFALITLAELAAKDSEPPE